MLQEASLSHLRRAEVLKWEELCRLRGVAVLFVHGNHYIAVDLLRESPQNEAEAGAVRVYERGSPAQWCTRAKVERIWTGGVLSDY